MFSWIELLMLSGEMVITCFVTFLVDFVKTVILHFGVLLCKFRKKNWKKLVYRKRKIERLIEL